MGPDTLETPCPVCSKPVLNYHDNGLISDPSYVLVGDLIFHSDCWDVMEFEHFCECSDDRSTACYYCCEKGYT